MDYVYEVEHKGRLQQQQQQQQQQQHRLQSLVGSQKTEASSAEAAAAAADAAGQQSCGICGDRATGKHYGAFSCDGCKGFFRRSVRKSHQYLCRFARACTVDKDKRNQCRYCRLEKCFRAGMRKEAVQNERDKISIRKPPYDEFSAATAGGVGSVGGVGGVGGGVGSDEGFGVSRIVAAESNNQQRQLQMPASPSAPPPASPAAGVAFGHQRREATVGTICDSMRDQLLLLVEWAKSFPAFTELNVEEQVVLLRAHAGEILLLGVTYRSRAETSTLVLGNSFCVTAGNPDKHMAFVASRVINEIVSQFREQEIDFTEYACLKAVVFFDPDAPHLPASVCRMVRHWRSEVLQRMQEYMSCQQYKSRCRFAELLLLLPKLQSINHEMIKKVYKTKLEGLAHIDALLQELLLGENADVLPPATGPAVGSNNNNNNNNSRNNNNNGAAGGGNGGNSSSTGSSVHASSLQYQPMLPTAVSYSSSVGDFVQQPFISQPEFLAATFGAQAPQRQLDDVTFRAAQESDTRSGGVFGQTERLGGSQAPEFNTSSAEFDASSAVANGCDAVLSATDFHYTVAHGSYKLEP